ncbi:MAG: HEAT repeat domain-containing protein, partial [Planctomycetota bacterium]
MLVRIDASLPRLAACLAAACLVAAAGAPAEGKEPADYRAIDDLGYQADTASAIATLTVMLKDADPQVRWRSARALGNLGDAAAPAAPQLVKLVADADPIVQMHAEIALARIGDKSDATIDALMGKITSEDERVARAAIQAIRSLEVDPSR